MLYQEFPIIFTPFFTMKIRKNIANVQNSWMGYFDKKDYEFFTQEPWQTYYRRLYDVLNEPLMGIYFIEDEQRTFKTR